MAIFFDKIEALCLATVRVFVQGNIFLLLGHVSELSSLLKFLSHGSRIVLVSLNFREGASGHGILVAEMVIVSVELKLAIVMIVFRMHNSVVVKDIVLDGLFMIMQHVSEVTMG